MRKRPTDAPEPTDEELAEWRASAEHVVVGLKEHRIYPHSWFDPRGSFGTPAPTRKMLTMAKCKRCLRTVEVHRHLSARGTHFSGEAVEELCRVTKPRSRRR